MPEPKLEDFFQIRSEKNDLSYTRDKLEADALKPETKTTLRLATELWLQQLNQQQ